MATILERYHQKFRKSSEALERGKTLIPGGGQQSRVVRPFPIFVNEGKGALKWDVDGNELVDYMVGFGSLILGHDHPTVTEAIARRVKQGTHMGTTTELEHRWAELIISLVPSVERVRFAASGTEATLLALRMARGFTGRTKYVKFRQHYHGWHDYVSPESGINTQVGIPQETLSTVVVLEPDIAALEERLAHAIDIAAVILEPTGGHWGQFPVPNPGFLEQLREVTARYGVVMIMDEVISGFRMSRGGAQERFGVRPDLTTMAKIVAGGLPGAAVGGNEEIMQMLTSPDETDRYLAHPGTFNANPVSAAAGIATLEMVAGEPINERADAMAARLKEGLEDALTKMEVQGHVHGVASVIHVVLGVECDCDGEICTLPHSRLAEAAAACSHPLKLSMLNEGVDMMGGIGFMLSSAHRPQDIDRTVEAFERSLSALREEQLV